VTDATPAPFTMVGDPAAAACEGDACLIPSVTQPAEGQLAERNPV